MRSLTLSIKTLFVAVPVILLFSCKKGDTGPAGPTGNANVIYSDWFTPTTYVKDTVFGIWGFRYDKAATNITQQVLDSGTVIFQNLRTQSVTGRASVIAYDLTLEAAKGDDIALWYETNSDLSSTIVFQIDRLSRILPDGGQ